MTHGLVLVAELMTVLVVVFAIGHTVANGYQALGQREVFLVARLTIHLGSSHIVTGADGIARELCSIVGEEVVEEVGSLLATLEKGGLARSTLVDDACGHEVTKVVSFEVQARGKGVFLVLADFDACRILREGMAVDACIALRDNHGGVDITVGTLGKCYLLDKLVHESINLGVFGDGIDRSAGFEPFVHVAIVEGRAVMLAFDSACSHLEIAETIAAMQS